MNVTTPDGRQLEVLDAGGPGLPVVWHSGTPCGPAPAPFAERAAREAGLRLVTYGRPGYGESSPAPGRTVADAAADTAAVLDALGLDAFVTFGMSGGGPHALACGALLPDRCRGVAVVSGVAPWDADGLDPLAGMGPENVEEFGLAVQGRDALAPVLAEWSAELVDVTADGVADSMGELVPQVDRDALVGEGAEWLAATFRAAVRHGAEGWVEDDLAFVQPWGFALADVRVPVHVWQGGRDLMVPLAHGQWLGEQLPGASVHLLPEHGHLSLLLAHLPEVLTALA